MKENEIQLIVKMAVDAWQTQNTRVDKLLTTLSDAQLANEIAPGKNTGTYLLGHLTAVNDNLFPLFGFGERLYPQLDDIFLKSPDKSGKVFPPISELKKYWSDVNSKLLQHISKLPPESWLTRHNSVSEEDFAKEPHRNKLNVLLNRTTHQSYHLGQMMLLK
jgi:hypothetical protein